MTSHFCRYALAATLVTAAATLLCACGGNAGSGTMPAANGTVSLSDGGSPALPHHKTFRYTGYDQKFIVPPAVNKITVVALGASGGGAPGARVGRVFAVIPVQPDQELVVVVGGPAQGTRGGFNGGAAGGLGYICDCPGYGGGGASDVREGGYRLSDRVLVAGGSGGQGGNWSKRVLGGDGGTGGGDIGGSGSQGNSNYRFCAGRGGTGGTQRAGGKGGAGAQCFYERDGNRGSNGMLHTAGAGGQGGTYGGTGPGGGGGGGGYYGGGGGGAAASYESEGFGGAGGGGGGSSYIAPGAIRYRSWAGWKSATSNGLVVFSW